MSGMTTPEPLEPDDVALMARIRHEDPDAFQRLVERHQRAL